MIHGREIKEFKFIISISSKGILLEIFKIKDL
jgi:hypothetical protein